jgi:hypothetical protein
MVESIKPGLPTYQVIIDGRLSAVATPINAAKMIAKATAEGRSVLYEIAGVRERRKAGLLSRLKDRIGDELERLEPKK